MLNKCLSSLDQVVVLSEVNPLGGGYGGNAKDWPTSIKSQAKQWHGYNLINNDFFLSAKEFEEKLSRESKALVIRDWSYCNFQPIGNNKFSPPNDFLVLKGFKELEISVRSIAFVRNAIDVYISGPWNALESFAPYYLNYVNKLLDNNVSIFKYEDFCLSPKSEMLRICEALNIDYNDRFMDIFHQQFNVSGDTQVISRGGKLSTIKKLPRKPVSLLEAKRINECQLIRQANELLNYSANYFEDGYFNYIKNRVKYLPSSFLNYLRYIKQRILQ